LRLLVERVALHADEVIKGERVLEQIGQALNLDDICKLLMERLDAVSEAIVDLFSIVDKF